MKITITTEPQSSGIRVSKTYSEFNQAKSLATDAEKKLEAEVDRIRRI